MPGPPDNGPSPLAEIARLFLRLGFTAFGGPAAHVSMIEDEVVHRRRWLDRQHFLDLVSSVNFIPGPNSTELVIHIGFVRAGFAGLVVAGVCFILPAAIIILPIAYAYVTYGSLPQVQHLMGGINAAVIAIVAVAVWRFGRSALTSPFPWVVAVLAFVAAVVAPRFAAFQPDLLILAAAAAAGAFRQIRPKATMTPLLLPLAATDDALVRALGKMCLFFLKVGGTLFGSGYVLISYLQVGLVDQFHWLTERQILDAVAVGQMTPGPLLTTATFVGYLLGHQFSGHSVPVAVLAAGLATLAIFLPSFVLVALLARVLPRLRTHPAARGALDAMNAAVVSLIVVTGLRLAGAALHDWLTVVTFAASLLLTVTLNPNPTWLVALGAAAGLSYSLF